MEENVKTSLEEPCNMFSILISVLVIAASVYIYRTIAGKIKKEIWKAAGKDVVLVHCPTPGYLTPNVSPFVMKLMTYLRLAQIPYKLEHATPTGKKGKTPWITLNGEDIDDSQLIVEALAKQFNKDYSRDLTAEQRAISRAFAIMAEDHLNWGLRVWRYDVDKGRTLLKGMKMPYYAPWFKPIFLHRMKTGIWHQGIGRHTYPEIQEIVTKDIMALSNYLGKKPYFMGDSLTEVDCTIFAFTANILYNYNRSPYYTVIKEDFTNLYEYVIRVKRRLWPDWDKCLEITKK